MTPDQVYQELKSLAEKLGVAVTEQNLRKTGIHVNSGLCKVKGKTVFVMDKHESLREKIFLLASGLSQLPHEAIYVVPSIRDLILQHSQKGPSGRRAGNEGSTLQVDQESD